MATQHVAPIVPFLDLRPVHAPLVDEILEGISGVIERGEFINGPEVARFEEAFARWCGVGYCVGLANGLDALRLGLLAAGIEPGDEVIVPANTFVATLEAVVQAGGVPVPADVSERDYNLDPTAAEAVRTPRSRFLLPVHLYGQLADMRALCALADRMGVTLLEDACQAHGATRDGLRAGSVGRAAAFSFYPGKNLGAMGDAGALVSSDEDLADAVRILREHGQRRKYEHERIGYTARLDTIQALVLIAKLPLVDVWNDERRRAARFYDEALAGLGDLRVPPVPAGSEHVYHLYVVRTVAPEKLIAFLRSRGVASGRHYPQPAHLTTAFRGLGYGPGSFPVSEALAHELVSLPIYPGIGEEQLATVALAVHDFFRDAWSTGQ